MPGINTSGLSVPEDYNLGRGKVYFAELDANSFPKEYRDLGNAPEFNVTVESETLEHQSSRGGLKVTDKEVIVSQKLSLTLTLDEINFDNLALFFSGTAVEGAANATVTGIDDGTTPGTGIEFLTNIPASYINNPAADPPVPIRWFDIRQVTLASSTGTPIGGRAYDIDNSNLVIKAGTDWGSGTTLVRNTDFVLDEVMGRFYLIETASVDPGDDIFLALTAEAGAEDLDEVRAMTQTSVIGALKFIAENPANNDFKYEYQFHKVSLKAEGDFALIGDEFTQMGLTAVAETNEAADADSPTLTIRTHANA